MFQISNESVDCESHEENPTGEQFLTEPNLLSNLIIISELVNIVSLMKRELFGAIVNQVCGDEYLNCYGKK